MIDLSTDPELGEAFFGLGTIDARAVINGLKAGHEYKIDIRLSNAAFVSRGSPFTCRGGIRLGAIKRVDKEEALNDAVRAAKESDGRCFAQSFYFLVRLMLGRSGYSYHRTE